MTSRDAPPMKGEGFLPGLTQPPVSETSVRSAPLQHTPGPWVVQQSHHAADQWHIGLTICPVIGVSGCRRGDEYMHVGGVCSEADARLIAAAPELLEALKAAQQVIDELHHELHRRRVADWYPEGAHSAAEAMSEDMRLLGNELANVDFGKVIAKAEGRQ